MTTKLNLSKNIVCAYKCFPQTLERTKSISLNENNISCHNYFHTLEQHSEKKGLSLYEYLSIPAFLRYGKNIEVGF